MLSSVFGKKIGMTQFFTQQGNVVPVTVIDIGNLFVTQVKTLEKDGYAALQLGSPKKRYANQPFTQAWCKNKKVYFSCLKEVSIKPEEIKKFKVGQEVGLKDFDIVQDNLVKITGKSKGLGFQGVVKRWGFSGGPDSHGSNFHRIPGAISGMTRQGEVIKGKKLPGHCGDRTFTIQRLRVVSLDKDGGHLLIKGAVPGKKNTLVMVSKQG